MTAFHSSRRSAAALLGAALAAAAWGCASAAERANQGTIRIVVPFAAGGSADMMARVVAAKVAERVGKVGVVDNKSGAGGQLGLQDVVRAAPDGNTLLVTPNGPVSVSPHLQSLPYDPARDLQPVAMIAFVPSAIAVYKDAPWKTLGELIAAGKSGKDPINYSVPAIGTHMHLAGALLQSVTGARLQAVAYRGTSQAAVAVASGEVPMAISDLSTLQPMAKAGRLRILALTGSQRTSTAPEIATAAELGVKDYSADAWIGMFAPAGTPRQLVERMNAEAAKVLALPEVVQALAGAGLEPLPMDLPKLTSFLEKDSAKWATVIKQANIKLDN